MHVCWSGSSSRSICGSRSGDVFDAEIVAENEGWVALRVRGRDAERAFAREGGGHRWQRVPPTEKRGRVHTSTVTVVVMPESSRGASAIAHGELEWKTCRGKGKGGQKRNKTESTVVLRHRPSGLVVRCEDERSQAQNRARALEVIRARLTERERRERDAADARERRAQAGSGMRGDKRRTVREQDGVVTDHATGRRWSLRDYLRGDWSLDE